MKEELQPKAGHERFDRDDYVIEFASGVAIVRFSKPEQRNPLSVSVLKKLSKEVSILQEAAPDGIIFTGSDGVFAAGANLREIAELAAPKEIREFGLLGQRLMLRIHELPIPTIAAIDGYCMGGALDLACACDRRFSTGNSSFAHPGVKLGIITGWGGTQFLPRLVGRHRAMELLVSGKTIDANYAYHIGLVNIISEDPVAEAIAALTGK